MRIVLVNTTMDRLNRGLGTMALQAHLGSLGVGRECEIQRVEVDYPNAWWEHRPFGSGVADAIIAPGMPYVLSTARMSREDLVRGARMFREHRLADRFQLDGPRQILDGILHPPPVPGGRSELAVFSSSPRGLGPCCCDPTIAK